MIITYEDYIFLAFIALLLIISVLAIKNVNKKEKEMNTINKAKKDMIDLEAITRNIESDYRPTNIELSSYEKEQENNAIISYEELVNNRDNNNINYDETYENNTVDVAVKKVDLNGNYGVNLEKETYSVNLMSYEHEEAFLRALRKLQSDLAR